MQYPNDNEIMGGVGYGDDQFSSPYHSNFSIYSNGPFDAEGNCDGGGSSCRSSRFNRNPYIPIENENMGRDWEDANYDATDPCASKVYPYRNVFDPTDLMIRKDYYLDEQPAP